jgi:RimJ/RimL family protein N-acetyltransferase
VVAEHLNPAFPFGEVTLGFGQLRELTQSDLDVLQSLLERGSDFYVNAEERQPTATEARDEWDSVSSANPRSHKHLIGLFSPDLVGVVEVLRDWPRPRTWNIGLLLLDPAVRRRRAGTQTVSAIDAWAARSGANRLRVSVLAVNPGALVLATARFHERPRAAHDRTRAGHGHRAGTGCQSRA